MGLALGAPAIAAFMTGTSTTGPWALHPTLGWNQSAWTYWTCVWLHANNMHLISNLAGLGITLAWGWLFRLDLTAAIAWFIAWPITHLLLVLLDPHLASYYGLSSVLHAGLSIAASSLILRPRDDGPPHQATIGIALLGLLLIKCWLENPHFQSIIPRADLGMNVAPLSHWAGTISGLFVTLMATLLSKRHRYWHSPASGQTPAK